MRTYAELFKTPGVAAVLFAQLLARFPFGMQTIAFAIHLEHIYGNYTVAGLAIAASTVGAALSAPILGRLVAVYGIKVVVITCALVSPMGFLLLGFAPLTEGQAVLTALVLGLFVPPIQPAARAVYPTLVKTESVRNNLFSVDAILQEVIWIVGPVLTTILIATTNTVVPLVVMVFVQVIGGLWFALLPEVQGAPIPRSKKKMGSVLRSKFVRVMIIVNLLFVGSFSALEIGAVAAVGKAGAGFVLAMLSVGSIVGALAFGHRARSPLALTKQLGVVLIGDILIFVNADDPIWLGVCLFISGIGVALAFATMSAIIAKSIPLDDTPEVYGWIGSGQNVGYGFGAAIAGVLVDHVSNEASFAFATGLDGVAMLVALAAVAITPSLLNSRSEKKAI
ncbi:MAG: MFS transporter [Rhodoluna sp.]|jgi:MFS family permease